MDIAALATSFETERPRLQQVAWRLLGSSAEAEDAVQEAWLRLQGESGRVANPGGWLTTVVSRISLDRLRARHRRREAELPTEVEQIADEGAGSDPERDAIMADAVGLAMLAVLDKLAPAERVSFVLHDLFGIAFEDVARVLRRSPEAARQAASRGRRRLKASSINPSILNGDQRRLVSAFYAAARSGNFEALLAILHPDVRLRLDAAASPTKRPQEIRGAAIIARRAAFGASRADNAAIVDVVNEATIMVLDSSDVRLAMLFVVADGLIVGMEIIGNPTRLSAMQTAHTAVRPDAQGTDEVAKTHLQTLRDTNPLHESGRLFSYAIRLASASLMRLQLA